MSDETSTEEHFLQTYHTSNGRESLLSGESHDAAIASLERRFARYLPADRSARILDIGCGEGLIYQFIQKRGYTSFSGVDISPENVELCHRAGIPSVQLKDVAKDDLADLGTFSLIFCIDVIEHMQPSTALPVCLKIKSLLAPGGLVVFQTPNMGSMSAAFNRYYDLTHHFGLTEKTLRELLLAAGFEASNVAVLPCLTAVTPLGRVREIYGKLLHRVLMASEGGRRPRIATSNLIATARL